jgi:magnesium chelatase family protein
MDLLVTVARPSEAELRSAPVTDSAHAAERVAEARERQRHRLRGTGARCNGELNARVAQRTVVLDDAAAHAIGRAYAAGALSPRGRHRVLRVAQTLADLRARPRVGEAEVLLALSLRHRGGGEAELEAA